MRPSIPAPPTPHRLAQDRRSTRICIWVLGLVALLLLGAERLSAPPAAPRPAPPILPYDPLPR